MKAAIILVLCLGAATAAILGKKEQPISADENVLQVAEKLGATELIKLVEAAGLNATLSGKGPFTLFAPTNKAIAQLDPWWVEYLVGNVTALQEMLSLHVVSGAVMSSSLGNDKILSSRQGAPLRANIYQNGLTVVTINGRSVVSVDNKASNGVVHLIEGVIYLPTPHDMAWVLQNVPQYSTLLAALKATNLLSVLAGPGPFTLFAPVDMAFARLPPGSVDYLLKHPDVLKEILLYHVVSGTYFSAGVADGQLPTLAGQNVMVTASSGEVKVNGVHVQAEEAPKNGAFYVLDHVLFPPKTRSKLGL